MALAKEIYKEFENIVGKRNISEDAGVLESYRCIAQQSSAHYGPYVGHMTPLPQAVILPASTDEVQQIVKLANRNHTPLVPVSSGPPHFNGDTVPSVSEAVIVDLSGMKKIIKIDRRNKIVIVEPGVTYAELQPALLALAARHYQLG